MVAHDADCGSALQRTLQFGQQYRVLVDHPLFRVMDAPEQMGLRWHFRLEPGSEDPRVVFDAVRREWHVLLEIEMLAMDRAEVHVGKKLAVEERPLLLDASTNEENQRGT